MNHWIKYDKDKPETHPEDNEQILVYIPATGSFVVTGYYHSEDGTFDWYLYDQIPNKINYKLDNYYWVSSMPEAYMILYTKAFK